MKVQVTLRGSHHQLPAMPQCILIRTLCCVYRPEEENRPPKGPQQAFTWVLLQIGGPSCGCPYKKSPKLSVFHSYPRPWLLLQTLPGEPVAQNSGLLETNTGLLWDIEAYDFQLLGCPGWCMPLSWGPLSWFPDSPEDSAQRRPRSRRSRLKPGQWRWRRSPRPGSGTVDDRNRRSSNIYTYIHIYIYIYIYIHIYIYTWGLFDLIFILGITINQWVRTNNNWAK